MAGTTGVPDEEPQNPYLAVPPIEPAPKVAPRKAAARETPPTPVQPKRPDPYEQAPAEVPRAAPPVPPVTPVNPYLQAPTQPYSPSFATTPPQGLSIASFALGIASIVTCCFGGLLFAIPAVILGHLGQVRQPWARGFWLTGLILGYIGVGLGALVAIYEIAIFASSNSEYGY